MGTALAQAGTPAVQLIRLHSRSLGAWRNARPGVLAEPRPGRFVQSVQGVQDLDGLDVLDGGFRSTI
jgi:hypothetical protein